MNDKREPISHQEQDEHRADVEYKRVKMKDLMNDVFGSTVHFADDLRQQKYDESRARLLSSPLLTQDLLAKTMISKFIDYVLLSSDDPFDSFCEVVSHFKGITKADFIRMDIDGRAKILGEH